MVRIRKIFIVALLLTLMLTGNAMAQTVTGVRTIGTTVPGGTLDNSINVVVNPANPVNGYVVDEFIPVGWTVDLANTSPAPSIVADGQIVWLFLGSPNVNINYRLNVPGGASGMHTFSGNVEYNDTANNSEFTSDPIGGDTDLCIPIGPEICNGLDDNCDGSIDEIFADLGDACSIGVGECVSIGNRVCSLNGSATECNAAPIAPSPEICDGLDNDCDGSIDEGDTDGDTIADCVDTCPNDPDNDIDGDGVCGDVDNCRDVANTDQWDANAADDDNGSLPGNQHYGNVCDPDFDNDGLVGLSDFNAWRAYYRQTVPPAPEFVDVDVDGNIGLGDFNIWRKYYRSVPGPGVGD